MATQPLYKTDSNGMPSINIGRLNIPIIVQTLGPTSPPSFDRGGPKLEFTQFCTAMAGMDVVRGTDVIKAGQVTTQLYITVVMWFQQGILANMRVLNIYSGAVYVIRSVENIQERNTVLILNCEGIGENQ